MQAGGGWVNDSETEARLSRLACTLKFADVPSLNFYFCKNTPERKENILDRPVGRVEATY